MTQQTQRPGQGDDKTQQKPGQKPEPKPGQSDDKR